MLGLVNRTKVGERLRNGSLPVSVFAGIEKLERVKKIIERYVKSLL